MPRARAERCATYADVVGKFICHSDNILKKVAADAYGSMGAAVPSEVGGLVGHAAPDSAATVGPKERSRKNIEKRERPPRFFTESSGAAPAGIASVGGRGRVGAVGGGGLGGSAFGSLGAGGNNAAPSQGGFSLAKPVAAASRHDGPPYEWPPR